MEQNEKKCVGLFGFGRTGRSVASALLSHNKIDLRWVVRNSPAQEGRYITDLLSIDDKQDAKLLSLSNCDIDSVVEENPVDYIVDFSSPAGCDGPAKILAALIRLPCRMAIA